MVPVGSILTSALNPDEFAQAAGDPGSFDPTASKWALADGRSVPGSAYDNLTHGRNLPDLRGLFLRGANAGRSDHWKDPESDREAGQLQEWATGLPQQVPFSTTEAGEHSHNGPNGTGFVGGGAGEHEHGPHAGPAFGASAMSAEGRHSHAVVGGDAETRPNNAAVYFFIRINP